MPTIAGGNRGNCNEAAQPWALAEGKAVRFSTSAARNSLAVAWGDEQRTPRPASALLDRRRAGPACLRDRFGPCRAQRLQRDPGLCQFAVLDPVGLPARPSAGFASPRIRPFERKAKPCAIICE